MIFFIYYILFYFFFFSLLTLFSSPSIQVKSASGAYVRLTLQRDPLSETVVAVMHVDTDRSVRRSTSIFFFFCFL